MKTKLASIILLIFIALNCFGQKKLDKAEELLKDEKYKKAIRQYSKYIKNNSDEVLIH